VSQAETREGMGPKGAKNLASNYHGYVRGKIGRYVSLDKAFNLMEEKGNFDKIWPLSHF